VPKVMLVYVQTAPGPAAPGLNTLGDVTAKLYASPAAGALLACVN